MKDQALTTIEHQPAAVAVAGQFANDAAASWVFTDYRSRKADNTLSTHTAALNLFADMLREVEQAAASKANRRPQDTPTGAAMGNHPQAWQGVTWGLVEAFKKWLLGTGYSIGTINQRLSVVRTYAKLASKAGVIPAHELTLIAAVGGYGSTEGKRINERRPVARVGAKKAAAVPLSLDQARQLKRPLDDTPQAARDALIMCLLLDHGLRLGEVAKLEVDGIDLEAGVMVFYRPKVDKVQTHKLTADTLQAARRYLNLRPSEAGSGLFVASDRRGRLLPLPMTSRAISKRAKKLGWLLGVAGLSPHDGRHYWATEAAANKTDVFSLRDAGGWSSIAMPSRYVEAAAVANEGVILRQ